MASTGMNLKKALRRARALGCTVTQGKGGEMKVSHPSRTDRMFTINGRRKDCPRLLSTMLQQLERGKR